MKFALFFLSAMCCLAQISIPQIGFVRDPGGNLRPVHGVAGAFVLGEPVAEGVVSAGFSEHYGLAKTEGEVLVLVDGEIRERHSAPAGLASFGFDFQGRPGWVRFESGECLVWEQGKPHPGTCPSSEPEASVENDELVLRRDGIRLRLSAPVKSVEALGAGWLALYTESEVYAVRTERGREALFVLPDPAEVTP